MGETLTERRRVGDEGLWTVKPCQVGRNTIRPIPEWLDGTTRGPPANSVPAAAVTRGEQALFGFIGRKELVGGSVSRG